MNVLIEFKNRIGVALIRVHYFFFFFSWSHKRRLSQTEIKLGISESVDSLTSWFNISPHLHISFLSCVFWVTFWGVMSSFFVFFLHTSKLLPLGMQYLAWAASAFLMFLLKLSAQSCQALTLKCLSPFFLIFFFNGEGLQKVQLCVGFSLHLAAVLAPQSAQNAPISHAPLVPRSVEACPS